MSTVQELYGLKAIVMFIHALPVTRKSVPSLISNAVELIKDIRTIVDTHKVDIYITLYDITLHYLTLHYITLPYITLYDITLHFTLHYKSS